MAMRIKMVMQQNYQYDGKGHVSKVHLLHFFTELLHRDALTHQNVIQFSDRICCYYIYGVTCGCKCLGVKHLIQG